MKKEKYENACDKNPLLGEVCSGKMWSYLQDCNKFTKSTMEKTWYNNTERNLKKLYPKHESLTHSFLDFGSGKNGVPKALVAVGAGPSLNNNIEDLEKVFAFNAQFPLEEQPFIIAASNHQYKPLLKRGIFPHFVFLMDGGDHLYDQLCKDIPKLGQATILVASTYASYKILKNWDKQGRNICFVIPDGEQYRDMFKKIINEDPEPFTGGGGGNVLNSMFLIGLKILHTRYYMALGNDLSFPFNPDVDERRQAFYADGDYSSNMRKGVDEARDRHLWVGYSMRDNPFEQGKKILEFKTMSTSRQLFIYKMWLDMHLVVWAKSVPEPFIYYNCSEGGIAGVLAKDTTTYEAMEDPDNWYLIDELIPKRWRTRSFLQAVNQFLEARLVCQTNNARNVIVSPHQTVGANTTAQLIT